MSKVLSFLVFNLVFETAFASPSAPQGAVATRVEGSAQLYIKKSNQPQPAGTSSVKLESEVYFTRDLKKGDRPGNGDVVVTGRDGKVRLIFKNGDQVTVTPGTAYKFSWDQETQKSPIANILFGDIRAVIQPGGPRTGMEVKTKSAVMGVRGTDFYASAWSRNGGTKVVVLRGKVALAASTEGKSAGAEKIVGVGGSGVVKPAVKQPPGSDKKEEPAPSVEVVTSTREELIVVQQDSKLKRTPDTDVSDKKVQDEIAQLEKESVKATLIDLKANDPEGYKDLIAKHGQDKNFEVDMIQEETVRKIFVTAPSIDKSAKKPTLKDLETGGDVYEKYKWQER